jgi:hypothetical protein
MRSILMAMIANVPKKLRNCEEMAFDFEEWLLRKFQKRTIIQIFERAEREIEQGDVFGLDSIE